MERQPLTLDALRDMISAKLTELNEILLKQDESIKKIAGMIEGLEMVAATLNQELNYGSDEPATTSTSEGSCSGACSEGTCACEGSSDSTD